MQIENSKEYLKYEIKPLDNDVNVSTTRILKKRVIIGRSINCDIIVDSSTISALHCILEVDKNICRIFDLNSKNGTQVNGKKIVTGEIKRGDKISIGGVNFVFREYDEKTSVPPVLDILEPGLPPIIQNTFHSFESRLPLLENEKQGLNFKDLKNVNTEKNQNEKSKPLPARPISFKDNETSSPSVIYPLSADSKAEFSEYIFEDLESLYPIFNYEIGQTAIEVMILHKDRIFSVDYVPIKTATYYLVGFDRTNSPENVEYPYLASKERIPFVTIMDGHITVEQPPGYEVFYLTDKKVEKIESRSGHYQLAPNEIIRFMKGNNAIFVRNTDSPPKVLSAPMFDRDNELKKYLFLMLFFIGIFISAISMYQIDEELEKEKVPETIRRIIYDPKFNQKTAKLVAADSPAIAKTETAPKEVVQKSPVQEVKEAQKPIEKKSEVKPDTNKNVVDKKDPGVKQAPKIQEVKKTDTKTTAATTKTPKATEQKSVAKEIGGSKQTSAAETPKFSKTNLSSKGHVDVYRSDLIESNLASVLAKGGSLKGIEAQKASSSSSAGFTDLATGGSEAGNVETARVSKNVGSLTGSATGKLDSTRGAEGLVSKRGVYTAGIPAETVVLGGMDPDVIRRILREHIPQFRYCYQRELDKSAREFSGQLDLDFEIGASGHVKNEGLKNNSELPANVKKCVLNVLKGIRFPEPVGGGTVKVSQPINFYPTVR